MNYEIRISVKIKLISLILTMLLIFMKFVTQRAISRTEQSTILYNCYMTSKPSNKQYFSEGNSHGAQCAGMGIAFYK